jgi:hypothetical protein
LRRGAAIWVFPENRDFAASQERREAINNRNSVLAQCPENRVRYTGVLPLHSANPLLYRPNAIVHRAPPLVGATMNPNDLRG